MAWQGQNASVENWAVTTPSAQSEKGVVASQHRVAAEAGAAMLDAGGNAVDAIVATAYAMNAVEPWMCGLGGSGFMVIWLAEEKRAVAIDFQGTLPASIDLADYPPDPDLPLTPMGFPTVIDNANVEGYKSITVPGAVAGLNHALGKYGHLGLSAVMDPAIQLAEAGVRLDWFSMLQISLCARVLARDPVSASVYLPGGHPMLAEQRLRIPHLADTLREIARTGAEGFYRGDLAKRIVADLQAGGSRISLDDMAAYTVQESSPMQAEHRGYTIYTCGETSGGLRQREMLAHTLANMPQAPREPTAETWVAYAEALDACWKAHKIRNGVITEQGSCTSSMSAVDANGNMVALTYTLLNRFGSGVTLPSTGMIMNDSVSYFDPRPGFPTTMEGKKRINSSNMCPTIAVRNGQARFSVGASGGNLIMPAVTQVAALMMDFNMDVAQAVHHPRLDAQYTGTVCADPRLGQEVLDALARKWKVEVAQLLVYPKLYACVSAVSRDPETGLCTGVNDPSQPIGGAAGPAPFVLPNPPTDRAPVRA